MENKDINVLIFENGLTLISQVERKKMPAMLENPDAYGDPDVKLTEPFVVNEDLTLSPWLLEYTNENWFAVHFDKILTTFEPNQALLQKYLDLIK